ncbi:uroporphyrinogen decarboxylase family protein [Verrucomicrobiota bacterium]
MPSRTTNSMERVLRAFAFERPDRIPRFDSFWEFPDEWRSALGETHEINDIAVWCPREGTFPTRQRELRREGRSIYRIDEWGRTVRSQVGSYFEETLEVAIPKGTDPDSVTFDLPGLSGRYVMAEDEATTQSALRTEKARLCVFGKTGGPYLRTTFVRGETQFLMDIAEDPFLARALADKMADHLTGIAVEQIRRWDLRDTGVWIYDDMAYNAGPMFSPASFETVFLPAYRRMVESYKAAGARYVLVHSDGNIMPILDMLVDAGIDGINPVEPRAGMDMAAIRERFPNLILTGGMDNTDTLINGPKERIEAEARGIIELGRDGGVVIGTHSISPEIPLENYMTYDGVCRTDVWVSEGVAEDIRPQRDKGY